MISKFYYFISITLIILGIICPLVHSLPFEEKIFSQNEDQKSFFKQFGWALGSSSDKLFNLQRSNNFDVIEEITEQTIKPIFDRLLELLIFPFDHPEIQENHTESDRNRGECQAPISSLGKRQGQNLCTICQDEISAATDLINYFQESRNPTELLEMVEPCKNVLNEYLFNYAFTYILVTKFPGFQYPSIMEIFPGMFVHKRELIKVKKQVARKHRIKRMAESSDPIIVYVKPKVYEDMELNLNYFREDYGYNSHHWNWHIVHGPFTSTDRRGELFWYMHHQMLARYDLERLSLGMDRVKNPGPLNQPIEVGYFPNLDPSTNGEDWTSRQDNTMLRSVESNGKVTHDIEDIELWHTRLSQAARDGFMINQDGQRVEISDDVEIRSGVRRGIDIFTAATVSGNQISPDVDFYGNLHNHGHNIIAHAVDPEDRHQLGTIGVMASAAVSARDPVFYVWHKYVEDIIQEYKQTQLPYTLQRLELASIFLSDVQVTAESDNIVRHRRQYKEYSPESADAEILEGAENITIPSELLTGCNNYAIDISQGLDFGYRNSHIILELTHLDHVPFWYNINIRNDRPVSKNVMVRIFLGPKFGTDGPMPLNEQQHLFILLDKFKFELTPGQNLIHRLSTESSLTSKCRNATRRDSSRRSYSNRGIFGGGHCGCGWPHHLLLPRGSPEGMVFQLFVLLTDWDLDYGKYLLTDWDLDYVSSDNIVSSICGSVGDKYPDWQPMGYPFDRPFHQDITYIDQLAEHLSNAHVSDVSIRYTGRNIVTNELTC